MKFLRNFFRCRFDIKDKQQNITWLKQADPALPVLMVSPCQNISEELAQHVNFLSEYYNILLCEGGTSWKEIRRVLKAQKLSYKNIAAYLFNISPNKSLTKACQRRAIALIAFVEHDDYFDAANMLRIADKIVYASKRIVDIMAANIFWGYPIDLTILSPTQDRHNLTTKMRSLIKEASLSLKLRQQEIKFLIKNQPINLSYWKARKTYLGLRRREAARYLRSWRTGLSPKRPIPGFHPGIYAEHHNLTTPTGVISDPFIHYLQAGKPQGEWNWPVLNVTKPLSLLTKKLRVALHIHAYYPEMLLDIIKRLRVNIIRPDLFISVTDEAALQMAKNCLASYERPSTIRIVPNLGRDIGPFLTEFGKELIANYDILGHVHTKKSLHRKDRDQVNRWRNFLLENLLGDGRQLQAADTIIETMSTNSRKSICFPDDRNAVSWVKNRLEAEHLTERLHIKKLSNFVIFPVGCMFWIGADALRPFVELNFEWDDYPQEPCPIDGTMLHALERMFQLAIEDVEIISVLLSKGRIGF